MPISDEVQWAIKQAADEVLNEQRLDRAAITEEIHNMRCPHCLKRYSDPRDGASADD